VSNLLHSQFGGTVYPVNPKRSNVLGVPCWPDVRALPSAVDLAVIATAAATVPGVVGGCVEAGVSAAIVLSAGFDELRAAQLARAPRARLPGRLRPADRSGCDPA
jgi:acetyltransferase